jgi:hypothetical protein
MLKDYVACVAALGDALGISVDDLFGDYATAARTLLDTAAQELEARVSARIADARNRFQEKYAQLDDGGRRAVIEALEIYDTPDNYYSVATPCPACGHSAKMTGELSTSGPVVTSVDFEGSPDDYGEEIILHGEELACPVCGLRLVGTRELRAAKLSTEVEMDALPPGWYEPEYEGD